MTLYRASKGRGGRLKRRHIALALILIGARQRDPMRNLSECLVEPDATTMPGPCDSPLDVQGYPMQLRINGEPRCPIGGLARTVNDPDTGALVRLHDVEIPQSELHRLCPWTKEGDAPDWLRAVTDRIEQYVEEAKPELEPIPTEDPAP